MPVPKRRSTRSKYRQRRAARFRLGAPSLVRCPQCGSWKLPHRVCPTCGYYGEVKVIQKTKEERRLEKALARGKEEEEAV